MRNVSHSHPSQWFLKIVAAVVLVCLAIGPVVVAFADQPQPDPAGIATGDKTTSFDAGGNPFVVTEPTDKTAPDYAKNKKAFDDFQAQASK